MPPVRILLLFLGGIAAGFINVNAGGGSLITLPLLILFGLPAGIANGTNRVGVLCQNLVATLNFRRLGQRDFALGGKLGIPAVIGAVIGSLISLNISDAMLQSVLVVVLVMGLMVVLIPRRSNRGKDELRNLSLQMVFFFAIGLYGGFIQAGAGYLVIFSLSIVGGLSLKRTNSLKVIIMTIYLIPSLVVFIANGRVDWVPAIALAAGTGTGGWLGSTFSVKRGEGWIKAILAIAVLGMGGRLLGIY
jgi:uncharacterized membrane protein YfcA